VNPACELLTYRTPAGCWEEALPLGNGRIGAMVFGRPDNECFSLNHDTIWSGTPEDCVNPAIRPVIPEMRQLIRNGKLQEADELLGKVNTGFDSASYQPAGNLNLHFGHAVFSD